MPRFSPYGFARTVVPVDVPLTGVLNQTGQVTIMLSKTLGFAAELEKVEAMPNVVGTGAGASQVINVRKGTATGTVCGTVTVTLANQGTIGTVTAGTVTETSSANKFGDADTLTVEKAAAGTVFSAGGLTVFLTFRHLNQRAK